MILNRIFYDKRTMTRRFIDKNTVLALVVLPLLFCNILQGKEKSIMFKNCKTDWKIYIPEKPSEAEIYSAKELQRGLKKVSQTYFPIIKSNQIPAKQAIVLGSLESSPVMKAKAQILQLKKSKLEQIAIYTLDGNLYIAGNMPRAGLYAVYRFLQKELGVRWFWPGDDGEYMPSMDEYKLPLLAINDQPAFSIREFFICHEKRNISTQIWLGRNLLNGTIRTKDLRRQMGVRSYDKGHGVGTKGLQFEKFPQAFSFVNGKRSPTSRAGCWSNPDFTKHVVDNAARWIRSAEFDIFNMFPADVTLRCECRECNEMDKNDATGRWYKYYHKLTKEIKKDFPDLKFAGLAYMEYKKPPKFKIDWLEYVEFCQYDRCYFHKLNDPKCPLNSISLKELNTWCTKAPMVIYGYEFDIYRPDYMYVPFWNMLADQMKTYKKMGIKGLSTELPVYFPPNTDKKNIWTIRMRLPIYIYGRLLWNPHEDINTIIDDWCKYVYGPAAQDLATYHKAMAKAWDSLNIHITYFFASPLGTAKFLISPELITLAKNQFKNAEKKIKDIPNEKVKKRCLENLNLEKAFFKKWEEFYQKNKNNPQVCLIPKAQSPAEVSIVQFTDRRKGKGYEPTKGKVYWDSQMLHIQVNCSMANPNIKRNGEIGHDIALWYDDAVEIYIDPLDGKGYRLLAVNPAGGKYDAIGSDTSWSPEWSSKKTVNKNGFTINISVPLKEIALKPKHGTPCRLSVIRRCRGRHLSYPFSIQDLGAATMFYLVDNNKNK